MVKPRKASAAVAAREKARERAEAITRRNEELIDLAAGYFVAVDRVEAIEADLEDKIAALREQADCDAAAARKEAVGVVVTMLATGEAKRAVGERLGISTAEVTAAAKSAKPEQPAGTETNEGESDE